MTQRRFGIAAVCAAGVIGLAITAANYAGLRLNFTDSAPHGLWLVQTAGAASIKRGELVEVCPPALPVVRLMAERHYLTAGNCDDTGLTPLLKPVSAVPGDTVQLEPGQPVKVNGVALPNTAAMPAVPSWPAGRYTVQPGQAWLFSSYNAGSFDSRYFGPVELASVRGIAQPLAISGDVAAVTTGVTKQ
ncbi:conjugal transfer protein TraF [Salmonella enterica subsp. enterica serovar Infantis]|uniref:Conjugal transfer protein TraF n=1 Tax=Xanthomonas campestris pv. phaseoli TaxID=317013 RepID=A0AB34QGM2_XANCH|nr:MULTISPECIES: S26 family signal peptidase [Xanthomonas]ECG5279061.1 conjugal transfer protein TraF [Salmonella enterica subsp. enterica serovar Agona]ECH4586184.1 conjugal transfer protein TraF [Salmonella enterica]EDL4521530.1 conjugal transfer protein TraF [Salmonella enterica subsp. enterica serovar Infantis]EET8237134.1 conjugal transfer protein TraF [Escherichia coli]ATS74301.1 S26 family signal peptidase [Xanthomonas citri pv. phaseoli var. fuscans]